MAVVQWITFVLWMFSGTEANRSVEIQEQEGMSKQKKGEEHPLWLVVVAGGSDEAFREHAGEIIRAHLLSHSLQVESVAVNASVDLSTVLDSDSALPQVGRAKIVWWVDFSQEDLVRTYLMEVETGKIYQRDLAQDSKHPAIANEVLGNIAGTTAAAWLRGQRFKEMQIVPSQEIDSAKKQLDDQKQIAEDLKSNRENAPPKPSELNPLASSSLSPIEPGLGRQPTNMWWQLAGDAAYYGSTFSTNVPWQHGVAVGIAWRPLYRLSLYLKYIGVVPSRVENLWLTLRLRRYPVWIGGEYCLPVQQSWFAQLGGLLSIDYIFREARSQEASIPVRSNQGRVFVGLGARVGVKYWSLRHFGMGIYLGLEGLVRRSRYIVQVPEDQIIILPRPIRGFLQVEVSFAGLKRQNSPS